MQAIPLIGATLPRRRQHRVPASIVPFSLALGTLLAGCSGAGLPSRMTLERIDPDHIAYQALRQQDCPKKQFEDLCARTYALGYHDYLKLRNEYLQDGYASPSQS